MKKLLLVLSILLLLCGCAAGKQDVAEVKEEEPAKEEAAVDLSALTIVTPKGAPVLAFYDQIENPNYSRVTADAISALWTGDTSPDILVVDLTSGINAIKNGAGYKLGAIITFGNFYLASTGNDENDTMDADDKIVLFGNENMLPNKLWHYLYGEDYDASLLYAADAQQAAAALAGGNFSDGTAVDYVFLAQPALFASLSKNEKAKVFADIQEEYKNKSSLDMIQAAVFIKDSVDANTGAAFLDQLSASIASAIADPELVQSGLGHYSGDEAVSQYGFNPNVVVNVFKQKNALGNNAMGLGFARAIDIKADIDAFLSIFGIDATGEEIYFQ
ncbi:MAG: hypothetical protein K5648_01810 [Erysipelotrichaceae bacterium]|nr:hypothetical protein [Erysipelotrichaceae bacterium]